MNVESSTGDRDGTPEQDRSDLGVCDRDLFRDLFSRQLVRHLGPGFIVFVLILGQPYYQPERTIMLFLAVIAGACFASTPPTPLRRWPRAGLSTRR